MLFHSNRPQSHASHLERIGAVAASLILLAPLATIASTSCTRRLSRDGCHADQPGSEPVPNWPSLAVVSELLGNSVPGTWLPVSCISTLQLEAPVQVAEGPDGVP